MVYIDRNGRVCESRPWDLSRIIDIFTGLWFVIVHYFQTLVAPFVPRRDSVRRNTGWGSGGGGGGGGGGGNGGLRPNRRIGRITNTMDCNIPGGG
ncbi:glycine-rich selenoprotein-like [Glossina fuscipes]|uniref:Glycine-rich selenoprotein-like n=1 Tax=Glossina fuscipes TaxID=7396 RepID=A0A9C5Z1L5_9MUSC|nr:glycine-rich selenoprotein-like [Glossina fuscipes]